jgi:hypothetical protein
MFVLLGRVEIPLKPGAAHRRRAMAGKRFPQDGDMGVDRG